MAYLFIAVLAAIRYRLREHGYHASWTTVRSKLSPHVVSALSPMARRAAPSASGPRALPRSSTATSIGRSASGSIRCRGGGGKRLGRRRDHASSASFSSETIYVENPTTSGFGMLGARSASPGRGLKPALGTLGALPADQLRIEGEVAVRAPRKVVVAEKRAHRLATHRLERLANGAQRRNRHAGEGDIVGADD